MAQLLTVVAEMRARPGRESDLRDALLSLIEPTRKEDGCVQYDLHVHTEDPYRFVFYENWASRERLNIHLESPHLRAFVYVSADLLAEPMRVATYTRIA